MKRKSTARGKERSDGWLRQLPNETASSSACLIIFTHCIAVYRTGCEWEGRGLQVGDCEESNRVIDTKGKGGWAKKSGQ